MTFNPVTNVNDVTDISGGILFASLFNNIQNKTDMTILDQIMDNEHEKIVDIVLVPKELSYSNFRNIFYPTNNKHFQMNITNENVLNLDNWFVSTSDGIHPFVLHDFVFSAIEEFLGVSKFNLNPSLKIAIEKTLLKYPNIREFNKHGSLYALSWFEITTLLEQVGILYNETNDNKALLSMLLNLTHPFIKGLTIRIYLPFVVTNIYKGWNDKLKIDNFNF